VELSVEDESVKYSCHTDSDCVPNVECHPRYCVDFRTASQMKPVDLCTEIFVCGAAYNPENCVCREGVCHNITPDCKW